MDSCIAPLKSFIIVMCIFQKKNKHINVFSGVVIFSYYFSIFSEIEKTPQIINDLPLKDHCKNSGF